MSNVIDEPRVVEAGRGATWWAEGWRIFTSNFWTWIGIMIIYIIITMLISLVPYIGNFGHWLLTPVFMGGLMLGCHAVTRDEPLRVAHLFEGFQGAHFVPLMIIGAVNIALTLAIAAIAVAGVLGSLTLADMVRLGSGNDPLDAITGTVRAITATKLLLILLALVIASIFAMLNWFAPALVALQGATAVEAMKQSFRSCMRNWVPFLVYGLIAIVVFVVAILVFGGVGLVFGAGAIFSGSANWMAAFAVLAILFILAMALLALFVGPIVFGSTYAGYKDTLEVDTETLDNPAYH